MRLRRSDPSAPGIVRKPHGRGFTYRTPAGVRLEVQDTLERCRSLAIPPAWTQVWICPHPNGHIQAVGVDEAGRTQYIYHDAWHEMMAREKFDRMLDLADVLPAARRRVTTDLRLPGLGRDRILAGAFRMLDTALLRVGSESYAREHGSVGLTTLLGEHVSIHRERIVHLSFPGKSGQPWESKVDDPDLARLIIALKHRGPRAPLLAWRDGEERGAQWHPVHAADINDDVRRRTGGDFTAKDFRTLHGTSIAALALASAEEAKNLSQRRRICAQAARDSAAALGNTPAIARNSYIDPRVFDAYDAGRTIDPRRQVEGQLRALVDPQ